MDRRYEIEHLWSLAITKRKGWQQDNCPVVRGDYGELERAWTRTTKAMAEHQRDYLMKEIETAIERQGLFRKQEKAAGQWLPNPVGISVFINKKRWKNEVILNGEDEPQAKKVRYCDHPGCDKEVLGPLFKKCSLHHSLSMMEG